MYEYKGMFFRVPWKHCMLRSKTLKGLVLTTRIPCPFTLITHDSKVKVNTDGNKLKIPASSGHHTHGHCHAAGIAKVAQVAPPQCCCYRAYLFDGHISFWHSVHHTGTAANMKQQCAYEEHVFLVMRTTRERSRLRTTKQKDLAMMVTTVTTTKGMIMAMRFTTLLCIRTIALVTVVRTMTADMMNMIMLVVVVVVVLLVSWVVI